MSTTCDHVEEIANAIACHDFPGLPAIGELPLSTATAYRQLAKAVLDSESHNPLDWWRPEAVPT